MILPILISVSLAPGSYFFSAFAAVAVMAAAAPNAASAIRLRIQAGIVLSPSIYFVQVSQVMRALASIRLFRCTKRHCCAPPIMIDAGRRLSLVKAGGLKPNQRIAPRHPRLGRAGFRAARWLSARVFAAAGFHQLGSAFAEKRIAHVRDKLIRGETVYLAGLGPPGTHNSGVALVEVSQATGPRLIVNNEEERFSGNKHTTEYPQASIDAMASTLHERGLDIGDIA